MLVRIANRVDPDQTASSGLQIYSGPGPLYHDFKI